jgi:hypothetical protein
VVTNEFLAIALTFPRCIHKVIGVEYVVIISLNKWLASPKPVKVGAVVATRRLTKALQKHLVPKYINYLTFQSLYSNTLWFPWSMLTILHEL